MNFFEQSYMFVFDSKKINYFFYNLKIILSFYIEVKMFFIW